MTALWLAFILSISDGDTFRAKISLWTGQTLETSIRIAGIDTPELRGSKCDKEKQLALVARDTLTELLKGRSVFLSEVAPDKYGGRFLARTQTADGTDIGAELLKRGLAVSYEGRGKKHDWCAP